MHGKAAMFLLMWSRHASIDPNIIAGIYKLLTISSIGTKVMVVSFSAAEAVL